MIGECGQFEVDYMGDTVEDIGEGRCFETGGGNL